MNGAELPCGSVLRVEPARSNRNTVPAQNNHPTVEASNTAIDEKKDKMNAAGEGEEDLDDFFESLE